MVLVHKSTTVALGGLLLAGVLAWPLIAEFFAVDSCLDAGEL